MCIECTRASARNFMPHAYDIEHTRLSVEILVDDAYDQGQAYGFERGYKKGRDGEIEANQRLMENLVVVCQRYAICSLPEVCSVPDHISWEVWEIKQMQENEAWHWDNFFCISLPTFQELGKFWPYYAEAEWQSRQRPDYITFDKE